MDDKRLIIPLLSSVPLLSGTVFLLPSGMSECMSFRDEVAAYSWSGSLLERQNPVLVQYVYPDGEKDDPAG